MSGRLLRCKPPSALMQHHRHIVDAILRGEGESAERAMLEHLHQVGLDLISNRKR